MVKQTKEQASDEGLNGTKKLNLKLRGITCVRGVPWRSGAREDLAQDLANSSQRILIGTQNVSPDAARGPMQCPPTPVLPLIPFVPALLHPRTCTPARS